MINNLTSIQNNLYIHNQTRNTMFGYSNRKACYCVMGIFALSLGAKISKAFTRDYLVLNEEQLSNQLPKKYFESLNIPITVTKEFVLSIEELNLTKIQLQQIEVVPKNYLTWAVLNDDVMFSFMQFSILLNKINELDNYKEISYL